MTAVTTRRHVSGHRHGAPVYDTRTRPWTLTNPPRCACSHHYTHHENGTGDCFHVACGCRSFRPNTDGGNQ